MPNITIDGISIEPQKGWTIFVIRHWRQVF